MEIQKNSEIPEHIQRRIELSGLFYPLDRNNSRRWGTILKKGHESWVNKLAELAAEKNYQQGTDLSGRNMVWSDPASGKAECMFRWVKDPANLKDFETIYSDIQVIEPVFTYIFLNQVKEGVHCWDIFRMSKFSYLEHCNRIFTTK
ncbi:MAG: hypothetical protein JW731_09470 [Bacteroidales bacterium]|nr:hypothetical protein [Bacteroidales bacterium]